MINKITIALFAISFLGYAQEKALKEHLIFYAPFDGNLQAQVAQGDAAIYTVLERKDLEKANPGLEGSNVVHAKGKGRSGDALDFKKKGKPVVFYSASKNVAYSNTSWSGAVSFWLRLDPAKDLEPGYCDPIQITDVNYNDAALWVDFTKNNPRDFRLGVIGDLKQWNPENLGPDDNPEFEKRLVRVKAPPFGRDKWTHIVINFSKLGTDRGLSQLYVDGKLQGEVAGLKDSFTWNEEKAKIFLGLSYIGLMDELSIYNQTLSPADIEKLNGLTSLNEILK
ncbi:MAG: LamG-like jellyroll fold domain-containing protein [Bacteroidota bacterium]